MFIVVAIPFSRSESFLLGLVDALFLKTLIKSNPSTLTPLMITGKTLHPTKN